MASFCRGRRMKIVLITYCLFFVNQSKISTARERLAFNVTISFTTSVKHALAHRCSLNFTKVKLCQTKSTLRVCKAYNSAAAGTNSTCVKKLNKRKRLILMCQQNNNFARASHVLIHFVASFAHNSAHKQRDISLIYNHPSKGRWIAVDIDLVNTDIIVPRAPCSFQIQPSGSVDEILSTEHTYLGQVHPRYPYIF